MTPSPPPSPEPGSPPPCPPAPEAFVLAVAPSPPNIDNVSTPSPVSAIPLESVSPSERDAALDPAAEVVLKPAAEAEDVEMETEGGEGEEPEQEVVEVEVGVQEVGKVLDEMDRAPIEQAEATPFGGEVSPEHNALALPQPDLSLVHPDKDQIEHNPAPEPEPEAEFDPETAEPAAGLKAERAPDTAEPELAPPADVDMIADLTTQPSPSAYQPPTPPAGESELAPVSQTEPVLKPILTATAPELQPEPESAAPLAPTPPPAPTPTPDLVVVDPSPQPPAAPSPAAPAVPAAPIDPFADPTSAAAQAAQAASLWNGLLHWTRKSRGPQWDWATGMYHVPYQSPQYYSNVTRMDTSNPGTASSLPTYLLSHHSLPGAGLLSGTATPAPAGGSVPATPHGEASFHESGRPRRSRR